MQICMLIEAQIPERPADIELCACFGVERVVDNDTGMLLAVGEVSILQGPVQSFKTWLGDKKIWATPHPMLGAWEQLAVPYAH